MIPTVPLSRCDFNKKTKVLSLASEYFGMPKELWVWSEHTSKHVKFVAVSDNDDLFDQDGWDGEQQKYRPTVFLKNVDHLVIYNQH